METIARRKLNKKPVSRSDNGLTKISVRLNIDIDTHDRLVEYAKKSNRSKSSIVEKAIAEQLKK